MIVVITEKAIAGNRIAGILSGGELKEETREGIPFWLFERASKQFAVVPLKGHIVELDFPLQYKHWLGTDLRKLNVAPIEYLPSEKRIVALLEKTAKSADSVIVATDADREGESIGVEALNFMKAVNPKLKAERAYFSAITPQDINEAFEKLSEVDYNLADSADARREIDLIWGAVLTRFLSLVSGRMGHEFLSIGRVQGPTLKIIVDREKERLAFASRKYWVVKAIFEKEKKEFEAIHKKARLWAKEEAEAILKKKAPSGTVVRIESHKRSISRPIPFNTTGFLRAATLPGFSAGEAMSIAETLYMQGYISYPRTDNTTYPKTLNLKQILNELLKGEFAGLAEKILALGKLNPSFGKETKDHPPIHPVSSAPKSKISEREWRIYELIVRNFLATLAEDAQVETTTVEIDLNSEPFIANGLVVLSPGWKEFYPYIALKEVTLPKLQKGDVVLLKKLEMLEKETQPPTRYSQGALIKLMEQLGIGTKSTRHEIIKKLYLRNYISGIKSIEPHQIAFAIIAVLDKYSQKVVNPEMTSDLEKEMDSIAEGKKRKEEIVNGSRNVLANILDELLQNKDNIGSELRNALRQDTILAKCTSCSGNLRMIKSRFGKRFLGCTNYPKCTTTYPLPQKGIISLGKEPCKVCGKFTIAIKGMRYRFEMCIDPNCKSKDEWKAKAAAKKAEEAAALEAERLSGKKTMPGAGAAKKPGAQAEKGIEKKAEAKPIKPQETKAKPKPVKIKKVKKEKGK